MIPKKIHYCWFGGKPLPKLAKKCISSWKKYCPDYEIIRWDESNYNLKKNKYIEQAYNKKKWAFVTDYVRKDVVYEYGGIYFDTDVEVIKPIDDLLENDAFIGLMGDDNKGGIVATGLGFGAIAHHPMIKELRDMYNSISFMTSDGLQVKTNTVYESEIFRKYGLNTKNELQLVNNVMVYPFEYFNPMHSIDDEIDFKITDKTYSVHHYMASWVNKNFIYYYKKFRGAIFRTLRKLIGKENSKKIKQLVHLLRGKK